mmetsp:Transcript_21392/g.59487  ORF Transcript_21392/g.59487 Transcript_21392/m.59487 type:complete len:1310 (-) Transcript_21392:549-4478(-)
MTGRPYSGTWTVAAAVTVCVSVFVFQTLPSVNAKGSFQSRSFMGSMYAGGLDAIGDGNIYVTGISYEERESVEQHPSCFVTKFHADRVHMHEPGIRSRIGKGDAMETCQVVKLLHDYNSVERSKLAASRLDLNERNSPYLPFVVGGASEPHGMWGSKLNVPSGFIMTLKPQNGNDFAIDHGMSLADAGLAKQVSYPQAMLYSKGSDSDSDIDPEDTDPHDGVVYVASVSSPEVHLSSVALHTIEDDHMQPNWLRHHKYGENFSMTLQRFDAVPMEGGEKQLTNKWTTTFPVTVDEGFSSMVELGGMIFNGNEKHLIVAGTTNGQGDAYGSVEPGSLDLDGFIATVHVRKGSLTQNPAFANQKRVGTAVDDSILGICEDPSDPDSFFVVGSTGPHDRLWGIDDAKTPDDPGAMIGSRINEDKAVLLTAPGSTFAFVQKRNSQTLEMVWGRVWGANHYPSDHTKPSTTRAIGCTALKDGTLYVAGIVEDGAHVKRGGGTPHEGDDVVVTRFNAATGELVWITQFGSEDGSERLAPSGALTVDRHGNLIIFGDTSGSLYKTHDRHTAYHKSHSDVFLTTISKADGSHERIMEHPTEAPAVLPVVSETDPTVSPAVSVQDEILLPVPSEAPVSAQHNGGGDARWFTPNGLGIQSGPSPGSLFAGGVVYNSDEDAAYLTGIAYNGPQSQASCLLTKLPLAGKINDFGGATSKVIGNNDVLEICNTVALHKSSEVVIVGSADQGSALEKANDYPMTGFVMALNRINLGEVSSASLVTDKPTTNIEYPIDVVSDGDDIYVVSLTSTDANFSLEYQQVQNNPNSKFSPNWINMQKYGTSLDMTVTKLSLKRQMVDGIPVGVANFVQQWSKEFPVDPNADGTGTTPSIYLGGTIVMKKRGVIAIAGSTRGMGDAYGPATGKDEDGFIALIDMSTGELSKNVARNNIREGTSEDDIVLGICDDPSGDESSFYIVGATKGVMADPPDLNRPIPAGSFMAYARKVDANTLRPIWTVQLGAARNGDNAAPTVAKAFHCVASDEHVYIAGVVDDNAAMGKHFPLESRGGDDIWVAQVMADSGDLEWVRQEGSPRNDHIAPRGGLALTKRGSVLVFGDTYGSFFRERSDDTAISELFVMDFDQFGRHNTHLEHQKHIADSNPSVIAVPVPLPTAGPVSVPSPVAIPMPTPVPETSKPTPQLTSGMNIINAGQFGDNPGSIERRDISAGAIIGILIAVMVGILVVALLVLKRYGVVRSWRHRSVGGFKIEVKDGLVTDTSRSNIAPPPSSFLAGKFGMDFANNSGSSFESYADNLKDEQQLENVV